MRFQVRSLGIQDINNLEVMAMGQSVEAGELCTKTQTMSRRAKEIMILRLSSKRGLRGYNKTCAISESC